MIALLSEKKVFRIVGSLLTLFFIWGCTPMMYSSSGGNSNGSNALRVGISTNMPPHVYKQSGRLQGLEIDLAQQLGQYLKRDIKFVELSWDKQIPSLEAGKIDIIMSGMSITPKRSYRVSFAKPYMSSGQMLLVRTNQVARYSTGIYSLMGNKPAIGTIENTTGDYFITKVITRPNLTRYKKSKLAVDALIQGRIDVFVHDAPVICYYAAQNEGQYLTPIMKISNEEQLAWAVNKMDQNLLTQVNNFITTVQGNGSLNNSIKRWIPLIFGAL